MRYAIRLLMKKLSKERIKKGLLDDYLQGSGLSTKDRDICKAADDRRYKITQRIESLEKAIQELARIYDA